MRTLTYILSSILLVCTSSAGTANHLPSLDGAFLVEISDSLEFTAGREGSAKNEILLTFTTDVGEQVNYVDMDEDDFVPFMPSMGHGTEHRHLVSFIGEVPNQVLVSNIYFSMPSMGHHGWELRISAILDGNEATFTIPVNVERP